MAKKSYLFNDAGNAERFADVFKDKLLYDSLREVWMWFNGVAWQDDDDGEVMRQGIELLKKCHDKTTSETTKGHFDKSLSKPRINAMIDIASKQKVVVTNGREWNRYPMLLPCGNGAVDLETGKFILATPAHLLSMQTDVLYDAKAPPPKRWMEFISETWPDKDVQDYIWRAVGYSLTGSVQEEAYFAMYGEGSNGKSKFIAVIKALLRDFAHTIRFTALEHTKRGGFSNDIVEINAKRFLVASETNERVRLNEGLIKSITGGDDIIARQLYEKNIVFLPEAKLWLAFNHKPVISDQTRGFWRRTNLVPMPTNYSVDNGKDGLPLPDKQLLPKLLAELPSILKWAIQGCLEWQKRGLEAPRIVVEATAQYRAENHPLYDFLKVKYQREPTEWVERKSVYEAYIRYCEVYREKPVKQDEFNNLMLGLGFTKDRVTRHKTHVWKGLKVNDDDWGDADVKGTDAGLNVEFIS